MANKEAKKPAAKAAQDRDAESIIKAAKIDPKNIVGETADFLLSNMKAARLLDPWEKLSEEQQREMCEQARHQALALVAGAVEAMATKGLPAIPAKLSNKFSVAEGMIEVKASIVFDGDNAQRLAGNVDCMLVFASAATYDGEMAQKPEPDQKALPIDGDGNVIEHDEGTGEVIEREQEAPALAM